MIMTGPASAEPYFRQIDAFVAATLGKDAQRRYRIIIDDPREVARTMRAGLKDVQEFRAQHGDAYFFNWRLAIDEEFQRPFPSTHAAMSDLQINEDLPKHVLAANLRRAFSGIVSGNVREDTAALIEKDGPFEITASAKIMSLLDELLQAFVAQKRMKLSGNDYVPCYRVR
jgi:hypothetical protein